jgi:hypothetical protein
MTIINSAPLITVFIKKSLLKLLRKNFRHPTHLSITVFFNNCYQMISQYYQNATDLLY